VSRLEVAATFINAVFSGFSVDQETALPRTVEWQRSKAPAIQVRCSATDRGEFFVQPGSKGAEICSCLLVDDEKQSQFHVGALPIAL
jgi:hypothetical protein